MGLQEIKTYSITIIQTKIIMLNVYKLLLLFFFVSYSNLGICQNSARSIRLNRANFESKKVKVVTSENADHALRIASYLFNSKEFQDSLSKRDFNYTKAIINSNK